MAAPRSLVHFSRDLWHQMRDDRVFAGAGALGYFLVLAIFPGAIFVLTRLPYLSIPHMQQAIMDLLQQVLPAQSAALFEGTVRQLISERQGALLTFGLVFTIWSASTGMYAIIQQLNVAHGVMEAFGGNYRATYGSLGAMILLMLWLYLAGFAIMMGCEIDTLIEEKE
jgi:membrane protein